MKTYVCWRCHSILFVVFNRFVEQTRSCDVKREGSSILQSAELKTGYTERDVVEQWLGPNPGTCVSCKMILRLVLERQDRLLKAW